LKLTLNKSITATRLNPKTGIPYSEHEANIPFGAVLTYKGSDREMERFMYLTDLFRCAHDVLASALDGGKIPVDTGADEVTAAATTGAAVKAAPEVTLKFEPLAAGPYPIARAKVPGGWLVAAGASSVTFYPDPDHAWSGDSL